MKKYILTITILLFFKGFAQIDSGIIFYSKHVVFKDLEKKMHKPNEKAIFSINNQIEELNEKIDYKLIFNTYSSIFHVIETLDIDNPFWKLSVGTANGDGIYFDDIKNRTLIRKVTPFDKTYYVKSDRVYPWNILTDTKKIGKYTCYKAVCKQQNNIDNRINTITAWYCPSIPVSFGPIGFSGLPGLILELNYNDKFVYKAKEINLGKHEKINFLIPKKENLILKNTFDQEMKRIIKARRKNR